MQKEFQGSYHCGAVRFTFSGEEIRNGVYCNCSICMRKGTLMYAEIISPANLKNLNSKMMFWANMNSGRKLPSTISTNVVEYILSTRPEVNPDFIELM